MFLWKHIGQCIAQRIVTLTFSKWEKEIMYKNLLTLVFPSVSNCLIASLYTYICSDKMGVFFSIECNIKPQSMFIERHNEWSLQYHTIQNNFPKRYFWHSNRYTSLFVDGDGGDDDADNATLDVYFSSSYTCIRWNENMRVIFLDRCWTVTSIVFSMKNVYTSSNYLCM